MSQPAIAARRPASLLSFAIRCLAISLTEPQSLTTKPVNPHSPFKTSLKRGLWAVAGIPFISLKAFIKVPTPASTAARNGGKYTC